MIGLCTDSNAQVPADLVERFSIAVVPLTVVLDGVEHSEGEDLDADEFYGRFAAGAPEVSTAAPSPGRFAQAYEQLAAAGATEILSIHIGSAVSATLQAARLAAQSAPVPVHLVDTGTASFAIACCVWEAASALDAGASPAEAAAIAASVAPTVTNCFVVGGLDLARRGGRLAAGVEDVDDGTVPVLALVAGRVAPIGVAADVGAAVDLMAAHVRSTGDALRVGVGWADAATDPLARSLEERLLGEAAVREVVRYRVGPSVGAHTGPGTVGAVAYPTRR